MSEPYRLTLNFKNKSLFSDDVKDLRAQDFKSQSLKDFKQPLNFGNKKAGFQIWSPLYSAARTSLEKITK
jgi:hypothetical protein